MESDLPFDEIQAAIKENIELKADEDRRTIKIFVKGEVPEDMPIRELVQGEEMLKQMTSVFMGEKIDFSIEQLPDANGVVLQFDDDDGFAKMHQFLNGILYGDLLKNLMKNIMKAMFSPTKGEEPGDTPED